jgi:uncharacterized protein (TIGR02118 family)
MEVCLFITASARETAMPGSPAVTAAQMETLMASVPACHSLVLHMPVAGGAHDPYLKDESPPRCTMQLYFDELGDLETCLKADGALRVLQDPQRFAGLADCVLAHQAMAVRRFPVPDPRAAGPGESRCTYLVSYDGPAEDFNAWIGHYVDSHPPIMARFPGIRAIEIYTRLDYRCELPMGRSNAMQRNKVVFDSVDALNAALASPVRHEMREDFKRFPPFGGGNFHYPVISTGWRRAV